VIFETIIITVNAQQQPHATPFGVRYEDENIIIAPYKPSTTLNNILQSKLAVMNMTDDVRVFAGALTGRSDWSYLPVVLGANTPGHHLSNSLRELDSPCTHAPSGPAYRLADCLTHTVLALIEVREDETRPQLVMKAVASENHQSFQGFNRAQAAVVELSILVSRLHMLPKEKVLHDMAYLQIAVDKTAGEREKEAWGWLADKVNAFYAEHA
jgi:uncharacterized protein